MNDHNKVTEKYVADPVLPKPETLEFHSVVAEAKAAVADIFDKWERLNWIVERYGPDLKRRWMKRRPEQRRNVLLAAWPNMTVMHRPDFYALRHKTGAQRLSATHLRDAYVYPSINLEDLCQPKNLLLFLNSRGRHTPDTFAYLDMYVCQIGRMLRIIVPGYLKGYDMALTGHTTRESYGRILYKEADNDMTVHNSEYRAGDGLLILEIQQNILGFLVRCAETILSDKILDQNIPTPIVPAPQYDLLIEEKGTEWCSIGAVYAEAPYSTPRLLDIASLRRLASAKHAEAEDHVWALREDPGYFQELLEDQSEHRRECIPTLSGKKHPLMGKPIFHQRVIHAVVANAYSILMTWNYVLQELNRLQDMRDRYGDAIAPMDALPEDYAAALWHFYTLLDYMLGAPLSNLKRRAVASPPLRQHYARIQGDPKNNVFRRQPMEKDYLLWLVETLMGEDQLCGQINLLDELEKLTRAHPAHHVRISGYVASTLSEMAAMAEIQRTLMLQHSKLRPHDDDEATCVVVRRYIASHSEIFNVLLRIDPQVLDVGTPFAKFKYPAGNKWTRPVNSQLCAAEANLDQFWSGIDAHYQRETGKTLHEMLQGAITEREIQRTPPWTARVPEPASASTVKFVELFSQLDLEERARQSVGAEESPMVKMKIKTRGAALETAPPDAREPLVTEPTPDEASPTNFQLTHRAHKVFSALFSSLGVGRSTGDLPWKDFLHAMASIGFGITKIHGSAWLFQPSWAQERPIIFHEPHPASRIQFHHLRRHGRRLGRTYRWDCHTFELVEK